VKASEQFKGEVKIGDPTIVEYLEKNELPIVEANAPTKKAGADAKKNKKR
jgi:hypothetical protein